MLWHLKGKPLEVQKVALDMGENRQGFGLWLEQGLGKTAIELNDFINRVGKDEVVEMLVFAKKSLRYNWVEEARKWGVHVPIYVYDVGRWVEPTSPHKPGEPCIRIGYYENIHLSKPFEDYMAVVSGRMKNKIKITLDESDMIKNPTGRYSKQAHTLKMFTNVQRAGSGTPQTQSPLDWWAQLRFIGAIKGITPMQFRATYCRMGGFKGKQIMGPREDTIDQLHKIISSHGFRAEKKDWLDLPEKSYVTVNCEMSGKLLKMYREMELDFFTMIEEQDQEITAMMVITAMNKLQQISSGFVIDEVGMAHELAESPKIAPLKDIIESSANKVIVFTHYKYSTDMLERILKPYGTAVMKGGMQGDELQQQVKKFNEDPNTKVMIAMSSVGGVGFTLLGNADYPCHTTIYYENNFNLRDRLQSEDRNHRMGQKNSVTYYDFTCSKIEEKIISALQEKKELVTATMDAVKALNGKRRSS